MQVGIDVKFMHTNFDGRGLLGFGDMATSQKWPNFPFRAWSPWSLKNCSSPCLRLLLCHFDSFFKLMLPSSSNVCIQHAVSILILIYPDITVILD